MQSSAGSTRRVNLIFIALGSLLSALAIATSFWAAYYSSPRMLSEEVFHVQVRGEERIVLPLPQATGERIYYAVSISATASVGAFLQAGVGESVKEILIGEGRRLERAGTLLLDSAPSEVSLLLRCSSCSVEGTFSVRYFSVDRNYLLALNAVAVLSSLIGIGSLTAGSYGYLLSRRARSP